MADTPPLNVSTWKEAVEFAPGVHWIGALDPTLRTFDIILRTANGHKYLHNFYLKLA